MHVKELERTTDSSRNRIKIDLRELGRDTKQHDL